MTGRVARPDDGDRTCKRAASLSLVEPSIGTTTEIRVLQSVQGEQRTLNSAYLAQGNRQPVLPWIGCEAPQHLRGGCMAGLDRDSELKASSQSARR